MQDSSSDHLQMSLMGHQQHQNEQNLGNNLPKVTVTWRNLKDNECKVITLMSLCFCGHKLKDHNLNNISDKNFHCKEKSCLCPQYQYVPVQGTIDLPCTCKHSYLEHDPVTKKCLKEKCVCKNKFTSRFMCRACGDDQQIPNDYKTIQNPQDQGLDFEDHQENRAMARRGSDVNMKDRLKLLNKKIQGQRTPGDIETPQTQKQTPNMTKIFKPKDILEKRDSFSRDSNNQQFNSDSLMNVIEKRRNLYSFKDEIGHYALNSINPDYYLDKPYNSGIQRIEQYEFRSPQIQKSSQQQFPLVGNQNPLRRSHQNVYEFSNLKLEGSLNLAGGRLLDYGKMGLRNSSISYNKNPIPDHVNYGFNFNSVL
eukprot:403366418